MDMSKEEGEKVGLEIAFDIMEKVKDIADGITLQSHLTDCQFAKLC